MTLKLVNTPGGEALANTSFSVLTPGGDVIRELIGAFPKLVLAEGEYVAIARYEGKTFQNTFKVVSTQDRDVEIVAKEQGRPRRRRGNDDHLSSPLVSAPPPHASLPSWPGLSWPSTPAGGRTGDGGARSSVAAMPGSDDANTPRARRSLNGVAWMAGTSPAMTRCRSSRLCIRSPTERARDR